MSTTTAIISLLIGSIAAFLGLSLLQVPVANLPLLKLLGGGAFLSLGTFLLVSVVSVKVFGVKTSPSPKPVRLTQEDLFVAGWVYDILIEIYKENPQTAYMKNYRKLLGKLKEL